MDRAPTTSARSRLGTPRSRWAVATVGLALLLGAPLAWSLSTPPATVGAPPVASGADPTAPAPAPRPLEAPSERSAPAPAEPAPVRPEPPARIAIERIGVDHPVVPVGLEPDGTMEIPDDVHEIGWYEPGVRPGEFGSAVLSGHVDSRAQGRGAFFELGRLDLDDVVTLAEADGTEQRWRVVARTRYAKDELPVDELFTWGGDERRLVLITCGGEFDRASRHYRDNVVVIAVPA